MSWSCFRCGDTGSLLATLRDSTTAGLFAFACPCGRRPRNLPKWGPNYEKKYALVTGVTGQSTSAPDIAAIRAGGDE